MSEEKTLSLVQQIRNYTEFGRRLSKRWWIITISVVMFMAGSVTVALLATRTYQSRTLIAYKENVQENRLFHSEDRREENWMQSRLEQLLSSHTLLWQIASEYDLYPKERKIVPPEIILDNLRKAIVFEPVGQDALSIAFEYQSQALAQKVAARLADEYINQYVEEKVSASLVTNSFVDEEVKKLKKQLEEIEAELSQFIEEHPQFKIDPLTGQPVGAIGGRGRTTVIIGAGASAPTLKTSSGQPSNTLNVKNPELLAALKRKGKAEIEMQMLTQAAASDPRLQQAKQEVANAQQALAEKRRQYTDQHPDVQRALAYSQQTEQQLRALTKSTLAANNANALRLKIEISELDQKIATLSAAEHSATRAKQSTKKNAAAGSPAPAKASPAAALEAKFHQLMREREVNKAKYDELSSQSMRSRVAANLDKNQAKQQLYVIDAANYPMKPLRPQRTKLVLVGTALGLMLGLALAALLVIIDPRIYTEDDLQKVCTLPILAQISK